MRTLIGVDLPSFIAPRIMPPASKANSRSENSGRAGEAVAQDFDIFLRRMLALFVQLHLDHRIHRAGVGRIGGRPVGRDAESR